MNFREIRDSLLGDDLNKGLQVAADLREHMEIVHTSEYPRFINSLLKCFVQLLKNKLQPQMVDNKINKFRHVILEILHRLPNNEVLKPYVKELLLLVMNVVDSDNEDNAIQGLRVVFDLQKNYRPQLEPEVPRFLEMVNNIYRNLAKSVVSIFGMEGIKTAQLVADMTARKHAQLAASPASSSEMGRGAAAEPPAIPLLRSKDSFKVLTECPLIVMLLFQLYPKYIKENIPDLIPLMIEALRLQPQLPRSPDGVLPTCLRGRYKEMIACQVKTLSFLTYLLRGFTPLMQPYEKQISSSVINLLRSCPADAVATRKELLVATRHILATDFRKGFFTEVDRMLDEDLLVGPGRQARDTLRPLAYSTLGDLVHQVKDRLDLDQVSRVIQVFSRNIHDPSLPITIQITSARLLLNLVDYIFHNEDPDAHRGKRLLQRVLKALVYKFGTLRHYMPLVEEAERARIVNVKDLEAGAGPKLARAIAQDGSSTSATSQAQAAASPAGGPLGQGGVAASSTVFGSQGTVVSSPLSPAPGASGRPATVGAEAMEVDDDGTGAGEEQVDVGDDGEIEVGAESGGGEGKAGSTSAMASGSGAVGGRMRGGAAVPTHGGGRGPGAVLIPALSPVAATATGASSSAGAAAAGGRSAVLFGTEVANSAAATLGIAREPLVPRDNGATRKFALGGPPEVGDSVQEVKTLAKTMIQGLKTVIWCCSNYRQPKSGQEAAEAAAAAAAAASAATGNVVSPVPPVATRRPMTPEERDYTAKFFKWALPCLRVFTRSGGVTPATEWKEALDSFAGAFTVLGPYDLRMAVGRHISILFDSTLEDPSLLTIPQHLLANEAASCTFADVLLSFLVHQMDDLAGYDERRPVPSRRSRPSIAAEARKKRTPREVWKARQAALDEAAVAQKGANSESGVGSGGGVSNGDGIGEVRGAATPSRAASGDEGKDDADKEKEMEKRARMKAQVLLRLFKVVFGSVTLFPKNERMLRPHLQTIVLSCLRYTTRVKDPANYFFLLRALFRSISGGKFESSYKEIYPLLSLLLTELSKLHHRAEDMSIKNILVELCLTVPARLASLLPHLPLMMRLMVHALRCRGDLDGLALRTLEFWVDNLSPEYLYRIMSHDPKVLADVMTALCDNLRPAPFSYGTIALRLLGKLGGRNRRFLSEPMMLPPSTGTSWHTYDCLKLEVEWSYSADDNMGPPGDSRRRFTLPMDLAFDKVCDLLHKLSGRAQLLPPTKNAPPSSASSSASKTAPPPGKSLTRDLLQESLSRHKRLAFRMVLSCLAPVLMGGPGLPTMTEENVVAAEKRRRLEEGGADMLERAPETFREAVLPDYLRYKAQYEYKRRVMTKGIATLIVSASDPELKDLSITVLRGLILDSTRLTTPQPPASGGLPHGFSDLDRAPSEAEGSTGAGSGSSVSPGIGGAAEKAAALQDTKADVGFSPLEAVSEHLRGRRVIAPREITDAIVDGLSDVRKDVQGVALSLIEFIVEHSGVKDQLYTGGANGGGSSSSSGGGAPSSPPSSRPSWLGRVMVHSLFESLCDGCFEKQWRRKISSCRGIRKACTVMNWQTARVFEFRLMQALLFVIKDHPREVSKVTSEDAQSALYELLTTRYGILQQGASSSAGPAVSSPGSSSDGASGSATGAQRRNGPTEVVISGSVIHLLASELSNYRHTVRSTTKRAIELMASAKGCTTTEILSPCRGPVESQIFSKQLRAVQASHQVGILEALTYCLMLKPQLLTVTSKVMQILVEVLAMTETDEFDQGRNSAPTLFTSLPGSRTTNTGFPSKTAVRDMQSPSELPHLVQLRVSAIRLMHIVMVTKHEAFLETDVLKDVRTRCISLFFKSLTSRADQVVDAAQAALVQVIITNRQFKDKSGMQKDLLQSCLRPVLKNLTHIQKLSLPLLQGLSRLLYLLSSWFNVTLGDKLFGYLKQWAEPTKLQSLPEPKGWKSGEEPEVAAAILGLFHLLPHSPKFLDQLINLTLQLEAVLHKYENYSRPSSPFLVPLTKYLDRYASETMEYFLEKERLGRPSTAGLLVQVLNEELAKPLREKMYKDQYTDALLAACFQETVDAAKVATGRHCAALLDNTRRAAMAGEARLMEINQEHSIQVQAVDELKKKRDGAREALRRAQAHDPAGTNPGAEGNVASTAKGAMAVAQADTLLQAGAPKLASLGQRMAATREGVKQAKQMLDSQQKRLAAQQAPLIQPVQGGGLRLVGQETVLIPAPGAYPTSLSDEARQCLHQGLRVVHVLAGYMPDYLEKLPRVVSTLREVWRAHYCRRKDLAVAQKQQQRQTRPDSDMREQSETKLLVKCLMECYRANTGQVAMLLDMTTVFLYPTLVDFSFLKDFYRFEVPALAGVAQKRTLLRVFLETLRDPNISGEHKVKCLSLVVIPVLTTTLEDPHTKNDEVVTNALVIQLVRDGFGGDGKHPEGLRVELLKLAALLIEFMPKELMDHRKDLIKFAWNNIKIEDSGKHWAYVNVCRFICAYDTPPKIILQVYVQLLRCIQPEVKELVHVALDILVPALPFRLTTPEFMKAIKWTKKIMYEEGHALPQLIHMWHIIVRHPALFYSCRSHFVGQMVNSLSRLGLPPSCPRENRQLAVSLADLMITWEEHGRERLRARRAAAATANAVVSASLTPAPVEVSAASQEEGTKRLLEGGQGTAPPGGSGGVPPGWSGSAGHQSREKVMKTEIGASPGAVAGAAAVAAPAVATAAGSVFGSTEGMADCFTLNRSSQQVEIVVNFVVRVALFAMSNLKDSSIGHLSRQCLRLLDRALALWPDTTIKYTYFEKLVHAMIDIDPQTVTPPQLQATMKAMPGVLEASLDILVISLGAGGDSPANGDKPASSPRAPNRFVLQNVARFQRLLGPCLRADTPGIRQRLLPLVQRLAAFYGPGPGRTPVEFQECKFWDTFQGSVERRLKAAVNDKPPPSPLPSVAWHASAAASVSTSTHAAVQVAQAQAAAAAGAAAGGGAVGLGAAGGGVGGDADRNKALFPVKIVESVSAVYPAFAEPHAASLLELVKVLLRQHFHQAALTAASLAPRYGGNAAVAGTQLPPGLVSPAGTAASDPSSPSARLLPTPTMAVLSTAATVEIVADDAVLTEHLETLVICLKLLRDITARGMAMNCNRIFQSLSAACLDVLDKSDNVVLLTTVMGFAKDWLLRRPSAIPPSLSEQDRAMFFQRLVRLDRLSEVHAQPVMKMQLEVIDALINTPEGSPRPRWLQPEAPRLFMAGLMAADPSLRRRFSRRLVDEAAAKAAASAAATATRAAGGGAASAAAAAAAAAAATAIASSGSSRGAASPSAVVLQALTLDWGSLQLRFWPAAVVDALLGLIDVDRALVLEEDECLRPFASAVTAGAATPAFFQGSSEEERECLKAYSSALSSALRGTGEIVDPLRGLVHADVSLADEAWNRLLSAAWATFADRRRADFAVVAKALLTKPWHSKALNIPPLTQGSHNVNVVQSLLRAILDLRPLPPLPVDMLGALAVGFNAWHEVIPAFEYQVMNTSVEERPQWMRILAFLYKHLGEDDVCSALRRRFALSPETKVALSLETYGLTVEAQEKFLDLIAKEQRGAGIAHVSQVELETWEERWIDCTRQLSQWSVLVEFSSALQYPELMMESAWKAREWDIVRANINSPSVAAASEGGSPFFKLYEIYLAIVDSKLLGMEKLCMSCVQLALHQWQLLPRVHTGCSAHKPLLHLFHQMVELRETGNIVVDMARMGANSAGGQQKANGALINPVQQKKPPELKATLYTWRERLPNKWDALKQWDDIFCWRNEVFRIITSNFADVDSRLLASLHDTPWTMIKLAHTARKQGLTEVCLNSLSKLYSVATMDVQDAFNKLREQIIICHQQPREHRGGLNMINNTNLEFFDSKQKAELFRLKGIFLSSLGAKQEANNAYSHAVQISGDFAKGWYSWARYCDGIFAEQAKVHCAVQAMACYLQAINHNSAGARLMMPRVLWLLSLDDEKSTLGRTLETYGRTLPEWVWIPWIPQLLTSLTRREAQYVTTLVKALSQKYPQSVYYTLRAFLLERREQPDRSSAGAVDNNKLAKATAVRLPTGGTMVCPAGTLKKHARQLQAGDISALPPPGVDGAGPALAPTGAGAAAIADELMSQLRRAHCALGAEMETILEEVIVHFRPEPEEELHSAVHALLIKCFQLVTLPMDDVIPTTLRSTLERVCRKFFNKDAAHKSPKHQRFVELYQTTFEKDFQVNNEERRNEAAAAAAAAAAVAAAAAAAAAAGGGGPKFGEAAAKAAAAQHASGAAPSTSGLKTTGVNSGAGAGEDSRMTLTKVVYRLKKWKHLLSCRVFRAPSEVPLQRCSPYLAQVHCELETWNSSSQACIEIPGQYASFDGEPRPDLHAKLLRFHSSVSVLHRHGFSQRRLSMLGSDGRRYFFLVQFAIPHVTRTDERVMQVHAMLKRFLGRDHQTRRRDLTVQVPVVVPITPRMRLMEDHEAFVSLGEIYEADRHRQGLDPDAPIMLCRERVSAAVTAAPTKEAGRRAESEERVKVFDEICRNHVGADILTRYVHGIVRDAEAAWAFRRHFSAQTGICSLLCHMFTCGERFPHRMIFDRRTARVVSWEFRPGYTQAGLLELSEDVPFRLTRNMSTLMSPMLVEGVMAPTMVSISGALMAKKEVLEPFLALILRDDLLSWHMSKASVNRTEEQQKAVDAQLKERIKMNVAKVMNRLDKLRPRVRHTAQGQPLPVDKAAHDLIAAAQSEANLAKMSPTFLSFV